MLTDRLKRIAIYAFSAFIVCGLWTFAELRDEVEHHINTLQPNAATERAYRMALAAAAQRLENSSGDEDWSLGNFSSAAATVSRTVKIGSRSF